MKINNELKTAMKKYFEIKNTIRQQESENETRELEETGSGFDASLLQKLIEARDEVSRLISPDNYMDAYNEVIKLKGAIGELILENLALKSAVSRLGGAPGFVGNTAAGDSQQ
ncbi:hypothetical protein [Leminorella grimontii]|uniref:hypothetical protein n=1 Tax=Leminorella grimontii TaxID=82981 RepID=UPI0032207804